MCWTLRFSYRYRRWDLRYRLSWMKRLGRICDGFGVRLHELFCRCGGLWRLASWGLC